VGDEAFALPCREREEQAGGEAGQDAGGEGGEDDPEERVQGGGNASTRGNRGSSPPENRSTFLNPLAHMLTAKHNRAMNTSDMARALGSKGGKARAKRLAPEEKRRIAALGGQARAISFHATRRVAENFRYADAVNSLQGRPKVTRLRAFDGPLPRIHASGKPQS
jgi:hypothetical protein